MSANRSVVLLDGSMGQELVNRSGRSATTLWATQSLMDDPDAVRQLHLDYITAGARVITVNTYSCSPERLENNGIPGRFEELQQLALRLVAQARDASGVNGVRIAGCLPPLVGSYDPGRSPDYDTSLDTYRKIVALQQDSVDVFLCETVSSIADARAVATAATESGKPVWLALSVDDDASGNLRSGEPLATAQDLLSELGVAMQVLNCSQPESIDAVFESFTEKANHSGAYANGFTTVDPVRAGQSAAALSARTDLDPETYAEFAMRWVELGADMVGGCCLVGPAHIAELARQLEAAGYTITGDLVQ